MRRVIAGALLAGLLAGCGTQMAVSPKLLGPLTIHVRLAHTRVPAGSPLSGYALLTNNTKRTLELHGCPTEWLAVGLSSASIPFDPAFADDCFGATRLAPGTTRVPVSAYTTYSGCGGGPSAHEVPCPRFGDPLLPLGTYDVTVIATGVPRGTSVARSLPSRSSTPGPARRPVPMARRS